MKLIFLNSLPISKLFANKIDPFWFNENGFEVECWDVSSLFWSSESLKLYYGGASDFKFYGPNSKSFNNKESFKNELDQLTSSSIVWHLSWELCRIPIGELWVYNILKKNKIKFLIKHYDLRPRVGTKEKIRGIIGKCYALLNYLYYPPCLIIGSGSYIRKNSNWILPYTTFVSVPSPRVEWKFDNSQKNKTIVFVDESIEYAPDAKFLNYEVCNDLQCYYKRMNLIFDLIEKDLGYKILIAASGKYIYKLNPFDQREIFYEKTLELINESSLVLGHSSSAIEQSIISNVPIIILNDLDFTKIKKNDVDNHAAFFGTKSIYSDNLSELKQNLEMKLNSKDKGNFQMIKKYYKEEQVTSESKEIIKQSLNKEFQ